MFSKTLIIYQNKILFNIISELYSDEFNVIDANKNNYNNIDFKKNPNFLIITQETDLNFKNELIIKDFPLRIKKILELIKKNFLKNNYKLQSNIKVGLYNHNINSKEMSFNEKKIFLTEREANLILFLNNSIESVNVNKLQKEVWGHSSELETHTVETHIYRLRKKIKETFGDDNFIISHQDGYKIS